MSQSNRLLLGIVRETTPGTTPVTPRIRRMRAVGEQLTYSPTFVDSDEIRDDRMNGDPILVMKNAGGAIPFELSYPVDNSPLSEIYRSAFFNPWTNTPQRDNDGSAASVITGLATAGEVATVVTGAAFVANHLVRFTGFGVAGNNGVFKCTTGSATVPAFVGAGITTEASPAAAARMKVVGLQGASADITVTASGLASTALDFTTLPELVVGKWIKVGGTAAGSKFATAAVNAWVRITAIAAHALTCDNLPVGWAVDAGAGKTIKIWFGDQIKNGVTQTSMTIEKSLQGQTVPVYISSQGQTVNTLQHTITSKAKIVGSVGFMGMGGAESTVSLDSTYDPVTTGQVMAANANVGNISENGAALTAPNWAKAFEFTINNNLRDVEAIDSISPVAIREGEATVTGKTTSIFGDDTLLAKFYAGTASSISSRVAKNSQALIYQFPRVTYNADGNPQATAKNIDVDLILAWKASYDSLTGAQAIVDRLEYYEV